MSNINLKPIFNLMTINTICLFDYLPVHIQNVGCSANTPQIALIKCDQTRPFKSYLTGRLIIQATNNNHTEEQK